MSTGTRMPWLVASVGQENVTNALFVTLSMIEKSPPGPALNLKSKTPTESVVAEPRLMKEPPRKRPISRALLAMGSSTPDV